MAVLRCVRLFDNSYFSARLLMCWALGVGKNGGSPPFEGGVDAPSIKRSDSFEGAAGVVVQTTADLSVAKLRRIRCLRSILLMAQPPLLRRKAEVSKLYSQLSGLRFPRQRRGSKLARSERAKRATLGMGFSKKRTPRGWRLRKLRFWTDVIFIPGQPTHPTPFWSRFNPQLN
jgi:hypothetical protein